MPKKTLRISHYNIFRGGEKRTKNILAIIKNINPDVCGILEAVGWGKNIPKYKNLFEKIGYPFFYFIKSNTKYDIVIISKSELKISKVKKGICHSIVKVITQNKEKLNIYYLHLNPISEEKRLKEISILIKKINKKDTNIIMGDFNSLSISDKYNQKELLEKLKKYGVKKYGVKRLRFDVIKKIEKNNFVDAFHYLNKKFEFSTPTPFNTDINHKEKIRIDYAFINKKNIEKIKNCKIYKNKLANMTSDHYPLYLDIKN